MRPLRRPSTNPLWRKNLLFRKEQLAFTEIHSPYDVLIIRRDRDPGDLLVPGASLMQMISSMNSGSARGGSKRSCLRSPPANQHGLVESMALGRLQPLLLDRAAGLSSGIPAFAHYRGSVPCSSRCNLEPIRRPSAARWPTGRTLPSLHGRSKRPATLRHVLCSA